MPHERGFVGKCCGRTRQCRQCRQCRQGRQGRHRPQAERGEPNQNSAAAVETNPSCNRWGRPAPWPVRPVWFENASFGVCVCVCGQPGVGFTSECEQSVEHSLRTGTRQTKERGLMRTGKKDAGKYELTVFSSMFVMSCSQSVIKMKIQRDVYELQASPVSRRHRRAPVPLSLCSSRSLRFPGSNTAPAALRTRRSPCRVMVNCECATAIAALRRRPPRPPAAVRGHGVDARRPRPQARTRRRPAWPAWPARADGGETRGPHACDRESDCLSLSLSRA